MSIQYQTDEQGQRIAVVIPVDEWEALQAELRGDALLSPKDEEDRRDAYEALVRGEALDLGRAMADW
jgi:predicted negative regulator of RcsB-dependent stress response